jgi:hypothetical protein
LYVRGLDLKRRNLPIDFGREPFDPDFKEILVSFDENRGVLNQALFEENGSKFRSAAKGFVRTCWMLDRYSEKITGRSFGLIEVADEAS